MNPSVSFKDRSIAPAVAIFAVLFGVGFYAGNLLAATVSVSNGNSVIVNSYSSANGADGADGLPGANGADGAPGSAGKSSATVRVKTVINGKVVEDINESTTSEDGKPVVINVSGGATVSHGGKSEDSSNVSVSNGPVTVVSRKIETGVAPVAPISPSDQTGAAVSGSISNPANGVGITAEASAGREDWSFGIYSFIKTMAHHVLSFFHI